ncbi:MAG: hypothetical protein AAF900_01135 [Bacteroidota bacterium]
MEEKSIIILGISPKGKIAADIFQKNNLVVYGFLADNLPVTQKEYYDLPVLGGINDATFLALLGDNCYGFIALEDKQAYERLWQVFVKQYTQPPMISAIHPKTSLPMHPKLGECNLIASGVCIGPDAIISSHCHIGANAVIENGAILHNFVEIGAGAIIGAGALIQENVYIGPSSIIAPSVTIKAHTTIPSGSIIKHSIISNTL